MKARIKENIQTTSNIAVANLSMLDEIKKYPERYNDRIIFVQDTGALYHFIDNEFVEITNTKNEAATIGNKDYNLYEVNRQIINQLPDATPEDIDFSKDLVNTFIESKGAEYYMLLCREKNYYTIFNINNEYQENMSDILFDECVPNFGNLKCVNETEDKDAIEIWTAVGEEIRVMYLFPYDEGVIKCCQ